MRIFEKIRAAVLLYFYLFTAASTAHIISLKLRYDKRHMIPFSDFEFSDVGYVSFVISTVTVTSTNSSWSDPSRIGFILQHREVRNQTRFKLQENNTVCALDFKLNSVLFTFQNLPLSNPSFNKSFPVTYSGVQSLFFVNCNNESIVTMDGRAELYNIDDDDGTTKNYLSAGLTKLPFLSFILSSIYLSFLGFWILVCYNNRRPFSRTHLLMGVLLIMNFFYFICVAADLLYVKATGTAHGLDVLFCVFQLSRALFLFTMIVLIGAGWFLWKPYLFEDEIRFLTVVIVLQVCANVNPILPWEAPVQYNIEAFSLADFICCFVIYFPITLSVFSLQAVCETDLNAYRNLEKLSLFNMFLVVYMVTTRVIVLLLSTHWVIYAVKETTTLLFHMVMFCIFRPVDRMRIKTAKWNDESCLPTPKSLSYFHSPV